MSGLAVAAVASAGLLLGGQLLRQPIQAALDQLRVLVIAKRADRRLRTLEVLAGTAEIAELAAALTQVEVQRRIQTGHRQRHPSLRNPGIGKQVSRRQRSLIPDQLLVDVVLHIGHRVREDTYVQRIAPLPADLIPDLRKQVASSLTLALMMMQLHPLVNAGERCIGDHRLLLHGSSRDDGMDRTWLKSSAEQPHTSAGPPEVSQLNAMRMPQPHWWATALSVLHRTGGVAVFRFRWADSSARWQTLKLTGLFCLGQLLS
jgi:hypothetical protein